jgi:hypothetical protein
MLGSHSDNFTFAFKGAMEGWLISSQDSVLLDLPPCCVEFCPGWPSYFVVGTYNLVKDESSADGNSSSDSKSSTEPKTQSRNGSLIVFKATDGRLLVFPRYQYGTQLTCCHPGSRRK